MSGADESMPDDDDELLAAELAFGLVDGAERAAGERRLAADPAFAAVHLRWQEHGAAMLRAHDRAPRPSLWAAIEARLPANDRAAPRAAPAERWWRAGALAASAAAILLAFVALDRGGAPAVPAVTTAAAAPAPLVAMLTAADSKAVVAVSFDRAAGQLTQMSAALAVDGKAAELWVIPVGGAPRSLGVIAPGTASRRAAPVAAAGAIVPGATLAVSIEPAGGSPTGQPTGPVILSGILTAA